MDERCALCVAASCEHCPPRDADYRVAAGGVVRFACGVHLPIVVQDVKAETGRAPTIATRATAG